MSSPNDGFLKLKRAFFSHWLWDQERVYNQGESFLDLLQLAAFAPTKRIVKGRLLPLGPGELCASLRFLSTRWGWNKDKVSSFLKLLEEDGMIRRESRQAQTVIILCNYNKHMSLFKSDTDRDVDTGQTVSRQSPDRGQTNKKKVKKREEGEEGEESPPTPQGAGESSAAQINAKAELIYHLYPRKVGKAKALKAIAKALKVKTYNDLCEATGAYAQARSGQDQQYTPYPATWFNGGHYDDDRSAWSVPQTPNHPKGGGVVSL